MTNCARAGGCAVFNYPFLTSKERDIETGLDYFLARYYSSIQGRFTSPDEFTGGPDELYYFVDDASDNPTFYADLRRPQSLNKYQYAFNNPLRYVDPDGHDADEAEPDPDPPQGQDVKRIPVPRGPGPTPAEAQQTYEVLKKIWELPDPYLYPIRQTIRTSPDPTTEAVPIPPMVVPATPQAPPAPVQAHKKKKQSTGKNKDHKKDRERPGRPNTKDRQSPDWRGRQRPADWPKGKPWPPWKNPRPKDWPKYEPWPPKPGSKPKQPPAPKPTPKP